MGSRRRWRVGFLGGTALALVLGVAMPADARAASSPGEPAPVSSAPAGTVEREPTQAELDAQKQRVAELRAQAEAQSGDVRDARQATRAAATLAGQALEAYSTAMRQFQAAQTEEDRGDLELARATDAAQNAQARVGQWARQAYQGGSGLNSSPALNTLLGTNGAALDAAGISGTMHTLERIGQDRSADLSAGRRAEVRAELAASNAARATQKANAAANAADAAKTTADAAVAQQRRLLDQAEADLDSTGNQVRSAEKKQQDLQAAAQRARRARQAAASLGPSDGSNVVTGQVGSCTGASDVSTYPNGQIPLPALCPLDGAPGHYLRADAAFAFDQLSAVYAEQFGVPICVTDSYRDYATQVHLYLTKPNLAAKPGHSNHGWGTATDLCGGVQNFLTPEHEWLFANAPVYGWFHPAWAQPDGSRPEPWHWEFGG